MKSIMSRQLTNPDGPVVSSEKTLRALHAIRRSKLLARRYGRIVMARSNFEALSDLWPAPEPWLCVCDDCPTQALPAPLAAATTSEAATLRLALALPASLVLLEEPIKQQAKVNFIKAEGTVSILVWAYREGLLSAVQPMVKALQKLGHGDVVPPADQLEALWRALDELRSV